MYLMMRRMTILSNDDLYRLTGFRRTSRQQQALREMGVPCRVHAGRLIVLQIHVAQWIEGKATKYAEPDLSKVR
jgi:hypothetical protein